jgi:hypothetical protein
MERGFYIRKQPLVECSILNHSSPVSGILSNKPVMGESVSPVVLRKGKYEVVIYTRDHPPAHVHVQSAEKEARITLNPVEVMDNWGFNPREIRAILKLIQTYQHELSEKWNEIHPGE